MVKNESGENAIIELIATGKVNKDKILISTNMVKIIFILSFL
jgi:hypothetical protein